MTRYTVTVEYISGDVEIQRIWKIPHESPEAALHLFKSSETSRLLREEGIWTVRPSLKKWFCKPLFSNLAIEIIHFLNQHNLTPAEVKIVEMGGLFYLFYFREEEIQ